MNVNREYAGSQSESSLPKEILSIIHGYTMNSDIRQRLLDYAIINGNRRDGLNDEDFSLIREATKREDAKPLVNFMTTSEIRQYRAPIGSVLVGDNHIIKGEISVIGGAPGVGKSRAAVALAQAGATKRSWFGLEVHRQFKTMILQNENGKHRLKNELTDIKDGMEDFVRISEPPQCGLQFYNKEFRDQLRAAIEEFKPRCLYHRSLERGSSKDYAGGLS